MKAPSKALLGVEAIRGMYEYTLGWMLKVPLHFICPKGDGHPVMVIPGLGTSDGSTHYIRTFLDDLGYESHSWGLGRNMGPRHGISNLINDLSARVHNISDESGGREVSLIGWSLGGIYGREIAKASPEKIRQVITLGTPFKGSDKSTNATFVYELLSKDRSHRDPDMVKQIGRPPPVPFTSLYSKTDGVVHWESSVENEGEFSENIEVPGASHLGLGHNPISMYIIANRLSQKKETWKPFSSK